MKLILFILVALLVPILVSSAAGDNDIIEQEIKYSSEAELQAKLKEVSNNRKKEFLRDDSLSASELVEFKKREVELRKSLIRSELEHGEFSQERAKALHALGANMFRQQRFEELFEISKQIVKIHETLDGYEGLMTGKALGNMGTVAHKLDLKDECEYAMKRALYIMLHEGGLAQDSRDVLMHRGKMLTFQVPDAERTDGLSYDEYIELVEG